MRYHRIVRAFDCWRDARLLQSVVRRANLAAIRYEPVLRQGRAAAFVDLTFIAGDATAVVPFVYIDYVMLIEPERDPLVWPASAYDALDDAVTDELADAILPWLRSHSLSHQINDERINLLKDGDAAERFLQARELGFLGAAPFSEVAQDATPYVYAARFARNRRVGIRDRRGATGAAILSRHAREVSVDLLDEGAQQAASGWYGESVFAGRQMRGSFELFVADEDASLPPAFSGTAVVRGAAEGRSFPVIVPVPLEIVCSVDAQDGPEAGRFAVRAAREAPLRNPCGGAPPAAVGGSAGRILFGVPARSDRLPDANSDSARELAERLREEGFAVDVAASPQTLDVSAYDLVHFFGLAAVQDALAFLEAARAAGVRTVVTANLEDIADRAWWGTHMTALCYKIGADEQTIKNYSALLVRRALSTAEYTPDARQAPAPNFEEDVRRALALADVVFVSGPQEEEFLRAAFGYAGAVMAVAPQLNTALEGSPVNELVGDDDFILCHAPIEPSNNQLVLARAAGRLALPLVIAGPVADVDYLERIREFSDEKLMLIPDATAGELASLYRRARVFADVAWIGTGLRRSAQAAACGAALVLSQTSYGVRLWSPGVWVSDPASEESVAVALGDAWAHVSEAPEAVRETAARIALTCDPLQAIVATVSGYGRASVLRPQS